MRRGTDRVFIYNTAADPACILIFEALLFSGASFFSVEDKAEKARQENNGENHQSTVHKITVRQQGDDRVGGFIENPVVIIKNSSWNLTKN